MLEKHAEQLSSALSGKAEVEAVSTALAAKVSRAEMAEQLDARDQKLRTPLERALAHCAAAADVENLRASVDDANARAEATAAHLSKADESLLAAIGRLESELAAHASEVQRELGTKASNVELQQTGSNGPSS